MVSHSFKLALVTLLCATRANAFSLSSPPTTTSNRKSSSTVDHQQQQQQQQQPKLWNPFHLVASMATAAVILTSSPVLADEYGVEKEAPTLFTGETVLICTKRGPLGACTKTELRTPENDNDKADKYFKDPSESTKRKDSDMRSTPEVEEGNLLVERLRRQSLENKEKNDLIVKQKTLLNDQSASFGPFSQQVVILNVDGKGFTLLQNPQAMRLKKAGFIKDRQFIKQPTEQELDDALVADGPSLGDAISGFLGGGGD